MTSSLQPADGAPPPPRVVTLSASYGAGGNVVGSKVAERLGVTFVDRAIPVEVAEHLHTPQEVAAAYDEQAARGLGRWFAFLSDAALITGEGVPADVRRQEGSAEVERRRYVAATEEALGRAAASGAVILGRAGAVVLRTVPGALHVRLDGPVEARLRQAMVFDGLDAEASRRRLEANDRAREDYVRGLYGVDPTTAGLYHLVIDSTSLDLDACVEIIVTASAARRHAPPSA
ncbi:AAA family ATPase [Georgenia sp. SYP-B2076]|uniref:cytidylate kinase-like family protein n=1 Tax=Georgenia sp. SYP-B2076 TaxID=2495881 RepID=UPI000F8CF023|nr:cytidylate kinase-like family protein [Georgenia sp. SYP-B2076]